MLNFKIQSFINIVLIFILINLNQHCNNTDKTPIKPPTTEPSPTPEPKPEENLVAKGKAIYRRNCISCHNINPKLVGSVGPDLYGSSLDLLRSKVIYGTYPKGYKPKRNTKIMPKFPSLEPNIEAIKEFLNSDL